MSYQSDDDDDNEENNTKEGDFNYNHQEMYNYAAFNKQQQMMMTRKNSNVNEADLAAVEEEL